MIPYKRYRVRARIKLHTSPLRELEYERDGVFIRETNGYLFFSDFKVRKTTIVNIVPMDGEEGR